MNIAIYDIIHLEQIIPLIKVSVYGKHNVHFFTNESFRTETEHISSPATARITFSYKDPHISEYRFSVHVIKKLREKKFDVLILNSVDSRHILWCLISSLFPETKTVFNIHDANNLFRSAFHWNIKGAVRHFGKKWLISLVDGFIVNTEPMTEYLTKNNYTRKPVWWLPPVVYDEQTKSAPDKLPVNLIIPGSIDGRRRNYEEVLSVYDRLVREMNNPPRLILAGQPYSDYGLAIIRKAKQIYDAGGMIIFFNGEIPEQEFVDLFEESHLIWSPLVAQTSIFDGIPEIYGETKNSGNTHDAIRFARPMMIPEGIKSAKEICSSLIYYSNQDECIVLLKRFCSDQEWRAHLGSEAQMNARNFTVDKVSDLFEMMLTELCNSNNQPISAR